MRIYLAGGSSERAMCAEYMRKLRAVGHVITYDWTESAGWTRKFSPEEDRAQARADFDAVISADVVWILVPEQKSEGSHFELGAALSRGIRTVVSGPHLRAQHRIFTMLAHESYESHDEAFCAMFA